MLLVPTAKQWSISPKIRRCPVGVFYYSEMILIPLPIPANLDSINLPLQRLRPLAVDGDGEPSRPGGCFDAVSIAPSSGIVLHVVVKNEEVGLADLVKISPPGYIARLQNDALHLGKKPLSSASHGS